MWVLKFAPWRLSNGLHREIEHRELRSTYSAGLTIYFYNVPVDTTYCVYYSKAVSITDADTTYLTY